MDRLYKRVGGLLILLLIISNPLQLKAYWANSLSVGPAHISISINIGNWMHFEYDLDSWGETTYRNEDGSYFIIPEGTEFIYRGIKYKATKDFEPRRNSNINVLLVLDPLNWYRGFERIS